MNDFIRNNKQITSCTITGVETNGDATVQFAHFKEARYDTSFIVIYEYDSEYYYPMALEYRLIDNNILYLIKELDITTASELFKVLCSSMEKEEKWTNEFKLALVHLRNKPNRCFKLDNFIVDNVDTTHIYE